MSVLLLILPNKFLSNHLAKAGWLFLFYTTIFSNKRKAQPNQSLKLTEVAVDDFARAKQTATIGHDLPRADWIPLLRHFVAAA